MDHCFIGKVPPSKKIRMRTLFKMKLFKRFKQGCLVPDTDMAYNCLQIIIAHSQTLVLSFLKLLKSYIRHSVKQGNAYQEWGRRNEICATDLESLTPWHTREKSTFAKKSETAENIHAKTPEKAPTIWVKSQQVRGSSTDALQRKNMFSVCYWLLWRALALGKTKATRQKKPALGFSAGKQSSADTWGMLPPQQQTAFQVGYIIPLCYIV